MNDKQAFCVVMFPVAKYYRVELSNEALDTYWAHLGRLGAEKLYELVQRHISQSKWFPTIADLNKLMDEKHELAVAQQWRRVIQQGEPNALASSIVNELLGGFKEVGNMGPWERERAHKAFEDAYYQEIRRTRVAGIPTLQSELKRLRALGNPDATRALEADPNDSGAFSRSEIQRRMKAR